VSDFKTELGALLSSQYEIDPDQRILARALVNRQGINEVQTGHGTDTSLSALDQFPTSSEYTANQLGFGAGVRLAVEMGAASVDHCTYMTDDDIAALAGGDTVATFLPATDFSTRQPYPDVRRLLAAGGRAALASNCNPGSSYTTSIPFCIALAVRDMNMTIDEAIWAATAGGAAALRRVDIGIVSTGARADLVVLETDNPIDFVYRPGVPLVASTIIGGSTF